jgi:arylsulfatase A-like enzyme/tetratricopeptide (TPR) repeat protein
VAAERPRSSPEILLVTLDTTRADHLGSWGWDHAHTPNLDALASRGCRFSSCDTAAVTTLPSHASILTGTYPPRHGVRDNLVFRLGSGSETVAEILRAEGYDTAAVVSAVVLARHYGLDQGFGVYDDDLGQGYARGTVIEERDARATTDRALEVLAGLQRPYFLWVHYFDPHEEYRPPPPWGARVGGPTRLYDAEIAFMDSQLGRLLEAVGEHCLVLVVGDHGEMLGDHGEPTHGILLNRGARRVPLILAGPGVSPGREVHTLVRTVDVAPTLLEAAATEVPSDLDGESLLPLLVSRAGGDRTSYCEGFMALLTHRWYPLRALSDRRWLYLDAPQPSLYDLRRDPDERRDVASRRRAAARRWGEGMAALLASCGESLHTPVGGDDASSTPSLEQRRQLAALGYLEGRAEAQPSPSLPDPRSMMDVVQALDRASEAVQQARFDRALALLEGVLPRSPHSIPALNLTAVCLHQDGRLEEALELFRRAADASPRSPVVASNLAGCLLELGRTEAAEREFSRVLELDPTADEAAVHLARLLRDRGQVGEALELLDGVLEAGGRRPQVLLERGVALASLGRLEHALDDFRQASRRDPLNPIPLENAARAAYQLARYQESALLYERLLRLSPERCEGWKTLGAIALHHLGDRQRALRCFRAALGCEPDPREQRALRQLVAELE